MKIAIEGCAHGELDKIYDAIQHLEQKNGIKIDLLICCGDFQATRNLEDLMCMAVPPKYQKMCSFYKYYSGEKIAPVLTIFIGGNHEASNYLQELAYGGWVAPRIYYMGYASILNIAGVRIGGLSGIYKGHDYLKGHFEKCPYTEETKRSVYHIRNLETFRLKQVQQPIDIFLSHDWPRGIYNFGDVNQLLKFKPFFTDEVKSNTLGSKPCEDLLHHLKPTYWFSAHMHVKFSALVQHISDNEDDVQTTKFLSLDKCLPRRKFLQIIDVPHDQNKTIQLEYDLEWLTILHNTNHLLSVKKTNQYMPGKGMESRWDFTPTEEEMEFVLKKFNSTLLIPENFAQTVTPFSPNSPNVNGRKRKQPLQQLNPQTMAFCDKLSVDDPVALLLDSDSSSDFSQKQVSCSPLPSYLTPERLGNTTNVSLDDSYLDALEDSIELDRMSRTFDESSSGSLKRSLSSSMSKRLSMSLPSPQHSDLEEPMRNQGDDTGINSSPEFVPSLSLSHILPSSKDSGVNVSVGKTESGILLSSLNTTESLEAIVNEDNSSGLQPKLKKFKRRNQEFYTSVDDD